MLTSRTQAKLQEDYDTVQSMLDEKIQLLESLNREFEAAPKPQVSDVSSTSLSCCCGI